MVVRALATSFPSLKTLRFKCEGHSGDNASLNPPPDFLHCFFAALPQLLPDLEDLTLLHHLSSSAWPPGCIQHVSGLTGLSSLRLPSMLLNQDEVQLLANMPSLRVLAVGHMQLSEAIDARMCAWKKLGLGEVTGSPAQSLFLPLKDGMEIRVNRINWKLGDATTAAEVAAEAQVLAQASRLLAGCLYPEYGPAVFSVHLEWPFHDEVDQPPTAGHTAEIITALSPFDGKIWGLTLDNFTVDAGEVQAVAAALPNLSRFEVMDCLLTSGAWTQLHGLQGCEEIRIRGFTAVKASDVIIFASTAQGGGQLCFETILHVPLAAGIVNQWVDPIAESRVAILEALPTLLSHRQKVDLPFFDIVFGMDG